MSNVSLVGNATREAVRVTEYWMLVDRRGADECWPWTGYVEKGYGAFYWDGEMVGAHELAVRFTTGEVRHPSLDTCHSCHLPLCCNPRHVRYGTRQENVDDCVMAGRHARGERNGHALLTEAAVLLIRERAALGATGKALAAEHGISPSAVTEILRGRNWAHVGGPLRTRHGNTKHGRYAR